MKNTALSAALAIAFMGIVAVAPEAAAQSVHQQYELKIPRQSLDEALKALARQTGLQVASFSDAVDGSVLVGPVEGTLTPAQALDALLQGQGLVYKFPNERTISVGRQGRSVQSGDPGADKQVATELDGIQVTARKRSESIMEVPMNISVISSRELNERNVANVQDIYRTIAGGSSPTGQLILRGLVGGNTTAPGTTSQFVDGVPFSFDNVFDIEQVEVLRGPQGTLWGSNAIGGTVQIRTRQPQFNDMEFFGTIAAEREKNLSGQRTRTQAGINIPLLDDVLAMRLTASVSNSPGKIVNAYTGNTAKSDNEFIRTQLRWQPTDDLNINFGHIWVADNSSGWSQADRSIPGYRWAPSLTENPDSPWGYDVEFNTVDCPEGAERPVCFMGSGQTINSNPKYTVWNLMDGWSRNTQNLFSLRADYDNLLDIASVHYVGSYRKEYYRGMVDWSRTDMDDLMRTWGMNRYGGDYRTTHELRFQSLDRVGGFAWTAGFFQDRAWSGYNPRTQYQYHDTDPQSIALFSAWNDFFEGGFTDLGIHNVAELGQALYGNPGIDYNYARLQDYRKERAIFGELSYLLETEIGKFELTGGLRRFSFEDFYEAQRSGIWFAPDGNDGNPYLDEAYGGKESGSRKKFSVSYMPNDDMNIYALYSEGYRPGGNNEYLPHACLEDVYASAYQSRYNSDQIENYELGFKANLLDRRLRVSSAIYSIDWSNTWASVSMPSCSFGYTTNTAGKSANSKGFELESSLYLTDTTMLTFNYGYTDSELTADNPALQAKAGDDMTMVPKYNAYLALDQELQLFGRQAFARIDVASYGEYKSHFNTHPRDVSPAYTTVNLSGRIHLNDNLVMSTYITNLLNKDYMTYRSVRSRGADGNINTRYGMFENYGAERGFGVRLDYSF